MLSFSALFGAASDYGAAFNAFMNMWAYGRDADPQGQFEEGYFEMDIASLAGPDSRLARPVREGGVDMFWPVRVMAATDVFVRTLTTRAELPLTAAKILAEPSARKAYRVDETSAASVRKWTDLFVTGAPAFYLSMARREAREMTFTQKLEGFARAFEQWRNRYVTGYALMPFIKIVMNQVSMGMRLLPGMTLLTKSGRRNLRTLRQDRSMEYIRIVFGIALGLLVYNMVRNGILTVGREEDPNRRNVLRMIRQPFSVLVGGRWHYISDPTEHLFYPVGIMATVLEARLRHDQRGPEAGGGRARPPGPARVQGTARGVFDSGHGIQQVILVESGPALPLLARPELHPWHAGGVHAAPVHAGWLGVPHPPAG